MNVIVKYFNKKQGTIEVLRDYETMKSILSATKQEVKESYEQLVGVGSPKITGLPSAHNPKAGEERLVKGLDDIAILRDRYADAKEYMDWFLEAWNQLDEDEQFVLKTCFDGYATAEEGIEAICERYHIERTSAYKKKNRALTRLSILLFGK